MKDKDTVNTKQMTLIVHSGDFDKIMSAFIIGNGFLSMGIEVFIFFTFWGLMALKKKGFNKAKLSKMNFLGLGKLMIKKRLKKYNVASLEELSKNFIELGGKIIACSMTMQLMGIKKSDLREDLVTDYGTVGRYCSETIKSIGTIFI